MSVSKGSEAHFFCTELTMLYVLNFLSPLGPRKYLRPRRAGTFSWIRRYMTDRQANACQLVSVLHSSIRTVSRAIQSLYRAQISFLRPPSVINPWLSARAGHKLLWADLNLSLHTAIEAIGSQKARALTPEGPHIIPETQQKSRRGRKEHKIELGGVANSAI